MSLASRQRHITIDGTQYSIVVMSARHGTRVGTELMHMVLPIIGAFLDDDNNSDIRLEESSLFTEIALHITHNFDSAKIVALIDVLLAEMYKGSQAAAWEDEFAGRYDALAKIIEFALRENFGSFFTGYFKAKGLEIPTLESILARKATTGQTSKGESKESQS